jgi:TPR repeat protein
LTIYPQTKDNLVMRLLLATIFSLLVIPVTAAEWQGPDDVLEAAAKGNAEAQLEMGILYQFGFHMPGNRVPALAWYLVAAEQGNQSAAQRSAALEKEMLPTEVEEARRLSQDLAALSAISSSTPSNPSHIPNMQEQATDLPVPEQSTAEQTPAQGEISQEAMPEPLPELAAEPAPEETAPKTDGPIQPAPAQ